jgi:PII-like signaling protein
MRGTCLRFYVQEGRTHHHVLAYEWLLEQAKGQGLHGGSAFRAAAGFGRHGMLHEEHFYELAGKLPVAVEFIVTDEEADRFLTFLQAEELSLFYLRFSVEYNTIKGPKS